MIIRSVRLICDLYEHMTSDMNWFGKIIFSILFIITSPLFLLIALGMKK